VFFIASAVLHEEALCCNRDFVLVVAGYYSWPVFPSIKVQAPMKVVSTNQSVGTFNHYFCFQILLALFNWVQFTRYTSAHLIAFTNV
jgi:hypothetical protein